MLSYLVLTTRALVMGALLCGMIHGYTRIAGKKGEKRIVWILALLGLVCSLLIAWIRNTTSLIDTAILNGWVYLLSLLAFVVFLITSLKPFRNKEKSIVRRISWIALGLLYFTIIVYAAPTVWAYPYQELMAEKTIISTEYLMNMIGVTVGLVLCLLVFLAAEKCLMRFSPNGILPVLKLELLFNAMLRLAGLFSVLLQKRIVLSNHTMFTYSVFAKTHTDWFIYLALVPLGLAAILLWTRSFRQKEPYRNPAEHRQIRAKWRNIRRWASTAVVVCLLAVSTMTVVEAMSKTDTTLSPIEEATKVDDKNVYVSFDLVADGHLHRFAYETENGVSIRFIVIKKPNSSSYGVGLDACDVCGETGYYERDGQVVCNLCDVVMNISTIGFKGGCNPIVIPYEVNSGQIIVPIEGLKEYESEFK